MIAFTITIIGTLASVSGIIYAIYYARKSARTKKLVYESENSVPIAMVLSPEKDYELSISFKRNDAGEEKISSAHISFLRFANLGREPIKKDDIAPGNLLRVKIKNSRTLDISLATTSRQVINANLSNVTLGAHESCADISFDFLDHNDGALIRILTEGAANEISLSGDIIGMPQGIMRASEINSNDFIGKIGCFTGMILQIIAIGSAIYAFKWVTGSWENIWLLSLPFIALLAPGILTAIIIVAIGSNLRDGLPDSLDLPDWYIFTKNKNKISLQNRSGIYHKRKFNSGD